MQQLAGFGVHHEDFAAVVVILVHEQILSVNAAVVFARYVDAEMSAAFEILATKVAGERPYVLMNLTNMGVNIGTGRKHLLADSTLKVVPIDDCVLLDKHHGLHFILSVCFSKGWRTATVCARHNFSEVNVKVVLTVVFKVRIVQLKVTVVGLHMIQDFPGHCLLTTIHRLGLGVMLTPLRLI